MYEETTLDSVVKNKVIIQKKRKIVTVSDDNPKPCSNEIFLASEKATNTNTWLC